MNFYICKTLLNQLTVEKTVSYQVVDEVTDFQYNDAVINGEGKVMFNKNLKNIRLQQGLTQKQVADYLMVSAQSISKWEKGVSQS